MLPKHTHEKREIEMRNLTVRLKDMFTTYKNEHCNEKGRIEKDNPSRVVRAGLQEAKRSDNVFNITDKSKVFCIDTSDNCLKSMEKHT